MILSPLSQNFVIWLPQNFFYNEIVNQWRPYFKRMYIPYVSLEDMFNSQITSISFPTISTQNIQQQQQNYQLTKRGGKQLDMTMNKTLTLTVKQTEGYMTYFIARMQMEKYLEYGQYKPLYMPPINITILDEGGFENVTYTYYQLTPESLSDFNMSYAAQFGQFNTFTWSFNFNYFQIYYRDSDGARKKMALEQEYGMLSHDDLPNRVESMSQTKKRSVIKPIR